MRKLYLWLPFLPFALFWFGALLNVLAVTVNHGAMPVLMPSVWDVVAPGSILDHRHTAWGPGVHLAILCDWIAWWDGSMASLGDMCLWLGEWLQIPVIAFWLGLVWKSE